MKKQILALLLVLALLPGLSPAARAESVQAVAGTVTATDLYGYGSVGDVVLKGDTTLILDRDLTARSIRGDYALTVQDQGGHTLTVRMPTDEHVITANGSGHGISVKNLSCDASLDILSRKDGLNIDGDIFFTGPTLAVNSADGDAVYSRNGGIELHGSAILTAGGSCIYSKKGGVYYDGPCLLAQTTGSDASCVLGESVELRGGSMSAASAAVCVVSRGEGGITIAGKLTASSGRDDGGVIHSRGNGSIRVEEGSELTVTGKGCGLRSGFGVSVKGSVLNITTEDGAGIRTGDSSVWLTDSEVDIDAGGCPLDLGDNSLYVHGGTLTARAGGGKDAGIRAFSVWFQDGAAASVEARADAISSYLSVKVDHAELSAASTSEDHAAIFCKNDVMIEGGTVRAIGAGTGINCGTFYMKNGTLTARGYDKHAIVARYENIRIDGGSTLDAASGQETLYCEGDRGITLNGDAAIRCTGEDCYAIRTADSPFSSVEFGTGSVRIEAAGGGIRSHKAVFAFADTYHVGFGYEPDEVDYENQLSISAGKLDAVRAPGFYAAGTLRLSSEQAAAVCADGAVEVSGYLEASAGYDTEGGKIACKDGNRAYAVYGRDVRLRGTVAAKSAVNDAIHAEGKLTLEGEADARTERGGRNALYSGKTLVLNAHLTAETKGSGGAVWAEDGISLAEGYRVVFPEGGVLGYQNRTVRNGGFKAWKVEIDRKLMGLTLRINRTEAEPWDYLDYVIENWPGNLDMNSVHLSSELQRSPDGLGWRTVQVEKATLYTIKEGDAGYQFRFCLTADGYAPVYSDICTVPDRPALTGGIEYTSGAFVGKKLTTARTGFLGEVDAVNQSAIQYQWQRSSDEYLFMLKGAYGWKIEGATGPEYTPTAEDVGKYIRLTARIPGYTGTICSPTLYVAKDAADERYLVEPRLSYTEGTVTAVWAFSTQEYVLSKSMSEPTEEEWETKAVSPESGDTLQLPVPDDYRYRNVFVHTRMKADETHEAGTTVLTASVYTGTDKSLHGLRLEYSKLFTTVGDVTRFTVKPMPSDFSSAEWETKYVRWYINDYDSPGAAALYLDYSCTEPYPAEGSLQNKDVYLKALAPSGGFDLYVQWEGGYPVHEVFTAKCRVEISDENGRYTLRALQFKPVSLFRGESGAAAYATLPRVANLGALSFVKNGGSPAGELRFDLDGDGRVTVTAPEGVACGDYYYTVYSDGRYLSYDSVVKVTVREKTATVSFDYGAPGAGGTDLALLMADVMTPRTVPLGAQFILPENGFPWPEGWEFAGWNVGASEEPAEPGDGIDVTGDVTVTALWQEHVHTMRYTEPDENGCDYPGCMGYYRCEVCGKCFGDEYGLYGGWEDPAMYMIPAHGHDIAGAEPLRENETAPTCAEDGGYDTVLRCKLCGKAVSSEHTTLEALGHVPGDAARENERAPACTVAGSYEELVRCVVCGEELSRETRTLEAPGHALERHAPALCSCETDGSVEYWKCSVCGETFLDANGETPVEDPHELVIEATGHQWKEPFYAWAENYSRVTASAVCANDASHVAVETAETSYEVKTPPTADAPGVGVYTASFENELFETQTKEVPIPKLGAPSVNGGAVTGGATGEVTLSYSVANAPAGARLIAVRLDGWKMTAVKARELSGTTEGTLPLNGSGTVYKLFLVDSQGRPICEVWRS